MYLNENNGNTRKQIIVTQSIPRLLHANGRANTHTQTDAREMKKANGQEILGNSNNNKKRGGVFLDSACGCCKKSKQIRNQLI